MTKLRTKSKTAPSLPLMRSMKKETKARAIPVQKLSSKLGGSLAPAIVEQAVDGGTKQRIDVLNNKLLLAHTREESLREQTESLQAEITQLRQAVSLLQNNKDQNNTEHKQEILKLRKRQFRSGHEAACKELKILWSSSEFAAELMYGELLLTVLKLIFKQEVVGKLTLNMMPSEG